MKNNKIGELINDDNDDNDGNDKEIIRDLRGFEDFFEGCCLYFLC